MNLFRRRCVLDTFLLVLMTGLLLSNMALGSLAYAEIEGQSLELSVLGEPTALLGVSPSDSETESKVDTLKSRKSQLSKRQASIDSLPAFKGLTVATLNESVVEIPDELDFFESDEFSSDSGRSPPAI